MFESSGFEIVIKAEGSPLIIRDLRIPKGQVLRAFGPKNAQTSTIENLQISAGESLRLLASAPSKMRAQGRLSLCCDDLAVGVLDWDEKVRNQPFDVTWTPLTKAFRTFLAEISDSSGKPFCLTCQKRKERETSASKSSQVAGNLGFSGL